VTSVYGDQWGVYTACYFLEVGSSIRRTRRAMAPQECRSRWHEDLGPILDTDPNVHTHGQMITDPAY